MEWRDIESAPKDGTWFVAARFPQTEELVHQEYEVGCYDPSYHYKYEHVSNGLYERVKVMTCEWRGFDNMHRMTHWMPFPEPPQ